MLPKVKELFCDRLRNLDVRKKCELFCETVNIRGLSRAVRSKSRLISLLWLTSVLVCTASLLWQVGLLLSNYSSHPHTTVVGEGMEKSTFPYVSVCNLKLKSQSDRLSIEQHSLRVETCAEVLDYDEIERKYGMDEARTRSILKKLLLPRGYYSNFPVGGLNFTVENDTFLLSRSFEDWNFKTIEVDSEVLQFWHPFYRPCLTVKVPRESSRSIRAFSLILYLDDFLEHVLTGDYDPGISFSKATGVRILLHYPGSFPDVNTGSSIGPGTETTFSVQMQSRMRLPHPYNDINCTSKEREGDYEYDRDLCVATCMQDVVLEECGCLSTHYHFTSLQFESAGGVLCGNMSQEEGAEVCAGDRKLVPKFLFQLACEELILYEEEACSSRCPTPCTENSYHYSGKSAPWPDVSHQLSFYKTHVKGMRIPHAEAFKAYSALLDAKMSRNKSDAEIVEALKRMTVMRDNFVQIHVEFENEYPQLHRDVELITPSALISSIGGALSLWLGITAMTLVELVEFAYTLIASEFLKKQKEIKVDRSLD